MTTYRAKRDESIAEGLTFMPGVIGQDKGDVLAFCPAEKIRHADSGGLEYRNVSQDAWLPVEAGHTMLIFGGYLFCVPPNDMEEAFELAES